MRIKMKIEDLATLCLGGFHNTLSVERPISPDKPNEILFSGRMDNSVIPPDIREMEFYYFSVRNTEYNLRADIVIYVE